MAHNFSFNLADVPMIEDENPDILIAPSEDEDGRISRLTPFPRSIRDLNAETAQLYEEITHERAARRITHILLINAWRKSKTESEYFKNENKKLSTQIENISMQLKATKHMAATEKERVNTVVKESNLLKQEIISLRKSGLEIGEDRLRLMKVVTSTSIEFEECRSKMLNIEKEMKHEKSEKEIFEKSLDEERNKMKIIKEERNQLLQKLDSMESSYSDKSRAMDRLVAKSKSLEDELTEMTVACDKKDKQLQEYRQRCDWLQTESSHNLRTISSLKESNNDVTQQLEEERTKTNKMILNLQEKSEAIKLVDTALKDVQEENCDLLTKIQETERVQSDPSWSWKALQSCTAKLKTPLHIINLMGYLMLPFPPQDNYRK